MEKVIGIAAGIFTGVSLLPQLIKMIRERCSQDISVVMLVFLLVGLILWVIYGTMKGDGPIIVTNGFSLVVNCIILGFNFYYKKRGR